MEERIMIRSENGLVEMKGTRMTLMQELTCIIKSFVSDKVITPYEIFDIINIALKDEGVVVIKGSEKDLTELAGMIEKVKSDSTKSDEIEDDDSDEADDIFKFLRGDK
jgi:hypothetical protein